MDTPVTAPRPLTIPELHPSRSYYGEVARRLRRSPSAVTGALILALVVASALFAGLLAPYDPLAMRVGRPLDAPSFAHPMGTDQFGRDVLSRVLHGGRISLYVGLIAVAVGMSLGTLLGMIAGYYNGWPEMLIMRLTDALLAFPSLLLALTIVATLGGSLTNVMLAVGVATIPSYVRLVRGTVLSAREDLYVLAAHCLGVPRIQIMVRHLLPNVLAPIIVLGTVGLGTAIISAASLGYLGLGAQPPTPEWGLILNQGKAFMRQAWWISAFPGLVIMLTVFAINLLGDGLRDALDPSMNAL